MAEFNTTFHVEFRDQHGLVFSGEVAALSSQNSQGPFDILPNHAHFISLIRDQVTLNLVNGGNKEFQIQQGVLRCFDNKVEIFTGLESQVSSKDASSTPTV